MYDFENICRTCSCEGELQSLFVQDPLIIAEMLTEVVDIKIIKDDNFPQNICAYCLEKLKSAYNFKKQCQDIHMKFEEYCKSFPMDSVSQNFDIEDIVLDKSIKEENLFLVHLENETIDDWSEVNVVPILPRYENDNFSPKIDEHNIENELIKGKKVFKRRMHECQICSKKTTHLTEHMRSHTKEKPYKCEICGMEFSLRSNCLRHLRIHKNDRPHICNICERGFTVRHKLVAHMNIHSKETPFKCELCEESFKRSSQLKLHVSENHCNDKLGFEIITNIDNKKPFLCDHCGKSYSKKIQLEGHIRVHTGEKPFVCSVCNKSFYSSLLLSIHRKTHSDEKPYKCNYCDKRFRIRRECRRHELIHTGEKPLKCDICDKSFRQSAHLHRHKRTHTGEKPFSCSLCGRQFIASGNLTVHIRIHHTGETPYLCSICNKGFYDSTSMKKHVKKHLNDIK